jgi:hypothetical protein
MEKKKQFLSKFKEHYKFASWRKIAAAIKALEKDSQLRPVKPREDLYKAIIEFFGPDKESTVEGIAKYLRPNSVLIDPDEVREESYQIAEFLA